MDEKEKAVAYIKENKIDSILQQTLNNLYKKQPGNVFGYLVEELNKFAVKPTIKIISGYEVKSIHEDVNRVMIEATCLVHNHDETTASVTIGFNCLKDTMDLDELKAVNDALQGSCVYEQEVSDEKLKALDVSPSMKLSVSSALFKSSTSLQNLSTYESLQQHYSGKGLKMPTPIVSIINCGKNGAGKSNLSSLAVCPNLGLPYEKSFGIINAIYQAVEEMLKKKHHNNTSVAPNGAFSVACDRPEQMIEMVKEAIAEQELVPGSDFFFVLDCLATEFHSEVAPGQGSAKKGQVSSKSKKKRMSVIAAAQSNSRHRYDWIEGQLKPSEDLCDFLESLVENESIVALVDPLHHEDVEGYEALSKKLGSKCLLFSRSATPHSANVFRLHTTISHSIGELQSQDRAATILEAAVYEEGETLLADLALVSGCGFVMFGGFRGVRSGLYNRMSKLSQERGPLKNVLSSWGFREDPPEEDVPAQEE